MSTRKHNTAAIRAHAAAAADFEAALVADIAAGKPVLPPWSKETERLRRALIDGAVKPGQLSRMLVASPQLVVKIMHVVNSPLYGKARGRARVELKQAVEHLGTTGICSLVYVSLLAQVRSSPRLQHLQPVLRRMGEASVTAAAIGWLLAQRLPELSADETLLAGLMHNIGKLCILANLDPEGGYVRDRRLQLTLLSRSHARVADAMLKQLGLPDWLCEAVASQDMAPESAASRPLISNALAAAVIAARTVEAVEETAGHLVAFTRLALSQSQWQELLGQVPGIANATRDLFCG
jgi:HD-like signal output (HDOD) protein